MKKISSMIMAVVALMLVFCMTGCSNNFWATKKPLNPSDEIIGEDENECYATKKMLAELIEKTFGEKAVKISFYMEGENEQNMVVDYQNEKGDWTTFIIMNVDKEIPMLYRSAMWDLHQTPFVDDDPVMAEKDK